MHAVKHCFINYIISSLQNAESDPAFSGLQLIVYIEDYNENAGIDTAYPLTKSLKRCNILAPFKVFCQPEVEVMNMERFFAKHPVFTTDEFFAYLQQSNSFNYNTARSMLIYHKKSGNILQIRRGLFAVVPATQQANTFQVDPVLIAGRIFEDSILTYHTAMELHGIAYSVFNLFYYITHKKSNSFTFQGNTFKPLQFPKQLLKIGKENFATTTMNREGLDIKVTTIERTLVDSLHHPEYSGGWEEIWSSFSTITVLRLDQVIEYVLLLGNATTVAKVGFFLEQHQKQLMVTENHLTKLAEKIPANKHYLERSKRSPGKLIKRWNLIVPEKILTQNWEEPSEIF